MNIKHLLECYRYKSIDYKSVTYEPDNKNIATIHFSKYIKAVCVSDNEIILRMNLLIEYSRDILNASKHAIDVLSIIICSLHCLSNISNEEEKIILKSLGLYDGSFKKTKKIEHEGVTYICSQIDNILSISISKNV